MALAMMREIIFIQPVKIAEVTKQLTNTFIAFHDPILFQYTKPIGF
jgi:hypothetical protein